MMVLDKYPRGYGQRGSSRKGTTVQEVLMRTDMASLWFPGVQFSGCSTIASFNNARFDYLQPKTFLLLFLYASHNLKYHIYPLNYIPVFLKKRTLMIPIHQ